MSGSALKTNTVGMVVSFSIFVGLVGYTVYKLMNGTPDDELNWTFWAAATTYIAFLVFVGKLSALTGSNGVLYVLACIFIFPAGFIYTLIRMLYNSRQAAQKAKRGPRSEPVF
ncbi:hypothetical protein [Lysobacter sp. cf310]|uniref:hypothetical protein n=1 Tax=Lysobacter sp. cf310 TaxID=1761790 RepID=UPI0008EBD756|nr:hypothetical protein [Lysobacter sp. cf310]SFK94520.1 hypothetical protein SAMN04487938_2566 [Lysobacter sp. cf310]